MNTVLLNANIKEDLCKAVSVLKDGGLVALPTETVYGLAANMFDEKAVRSVFSVKKRDFSKPLTVHISNFEQINMLSSSFCSKAKDLIRKFWPGPLTIIVKKTVKVPNYVTNCSNYVGIRFPANKTFKSVVDLFNKPVVATSANISKELSPTRFEHVYSELNGKIDAILKDEESSIQGLESTIVSFEENVPKILRLGEISCEEIESLVGPVRLQLKSKTINYKSKIVAVDASIKKFSDYVNSINSFNIGVICFDEDIPFVSKDVLCITLGSINNPKEVAANFYDSLRKLKDLENRTIYIHLPYKEGLNFSIYNNILQLADFNLLEL